MEISLILQSLVQIVDNKSKVYQKLGSSCLLIDAVSGLNLEPFPPAKIIPFI